MSFPQVSFNVLPNADGSASYSWHDFRIICSVNGPIEPSRRDELPEEAAIEVNLREASGPGGTRERYLESIISSTLRSIILTHLHPRTLIQITLQILGTAEADNSTAPVPQFASHIPPLPHLLHAALFSLLDANIPLTKTFAAITCAVSADQNVAEQTMISVNPKDLKSFSSIHAFAMSSSGETLMIESEGNFSFNELSQAAKAAEDTISQLNAWQREIMAAEIKASSRWRGTGITTGGET